MLLLLKYLCISLLPLMTFGDNGYRLTNDVIPKSYDLWLEVDLYGLDQTVSGFNNMTLDVARETKQIRFHKHEDMDIDTYQLYTTKAKYDVETTTFEKERQFFAVLL